VWLAAGFPSQPLADPDAPTPIAWFRFAPEAPPATATSTGPAVESLFLPRIHTAARILKLAPPGGIAVTDAIVAHARRENPELAREFAVREGAALHLDPELRSLRIHVAPLREGG